LHNGTEISCIYKFSSVSFHIGLHCVKKRFFSHDKLQVVKKESTFIVSHGNLKVSFFYMGSKLYRLIKTIVNHIKNLESSEAFFFRISIKNSPDGNYFGEFGKTLKKPVILTGIKGKDISPPCVGDLMDNVSCGKKNVVINYFPGKILFSKGHRVKKARIAIRNCHGFILTETGFTEFTFKINVRLIYYIRYIVYIFLYGIKGHIKNYPEIIRIGFYDFFTFTGKKVKTPVCYTIIVFPFIDLSLSPFGNIIKPA